MAETWTEKQRRLDRLKAERERRRKRRSRRKADPLQQLLSAPKGAVQSTFRRMKRKARKRVKQQVRSMSYRQRKRVFGLCPTCNKANSPGHTCRMSFTEYNADQMRRRYGKHGGLPASSQNPNLWTRQ